MYKRQGIGENSGTVRAMVLENLEYLGIAVDEEANKKRGEDLVISTADSKVKVAVIPTNEELAIARETVAVSYTHLNNMYPVDLAEILEGFEQKQLVMVFRLLAKEEAAETFTYMNSDMREILINALTDSELEEVMEEMYLDDTVDVLEEMPANVVDRLLMATDEEKRAQINQLLQYPEDSAGSVMNVDYIALSQEMTVEDAIMKIRQVGLNRETIYTCYVTEKRRLIGVVDIKDLLTTGESRTIDEIMDTNMLYAQLSLIHI